MALLSIPIQDSPDSSFTTILDGIAYDFRLQWNGRDESWYLYCGPPNQPFLFKTKVTSGADFLKSYRAYEDCPKGIMLAVDLNKKYGRLQRDSFSTGRFELLYITADSRESLVREGLI